MLPAPIKEILGNSHLLNKYQEKKKSTIKKLHKGAWQGAGTGSCAHYTTITAPFPLYFHLEQKVSVCRRGRQLPTPAAPFPTAEHARRERCPRSGDKPSTFEPSMYQPPYTAASLATSVLAREQPLPIARLAKSRVRTAARASAQPRESASLPRPPPAQSAGNRAGSAVPTPPPARGCRGARHKPPAAPGSYHARPGPCSCSGAARPPAQLRTGDPEPAVPPLPRVTGQTSAQLSSARARAGYADEAQPGFLPFPAQPSPARPDRMM